METSRLADLHAYVDDCLEPRERDAFEALMAEDPVLASRAAQWRAQNSAIRAAFDGDGTRAFSISILRHQNENLSKIRRVPSAGARVSREQSSRSASSAITHASLAGAQHAVHAPLSWRLGLGALVIVLACAWSPGGLGVPARELGLAGVAAFRAFARPDAAPVEFASSNPAQSQDWLAVRLSRPVYVPPLPPSLSLVGARIAPAPGSSAAFLLFKSGDNLVGLIVKPLDAATARAPELLLADGREAAVWIWGGQGFALAGDVDTPSLVRLANDFFSQPFDGAAQLTPERGS